MKRWLTSLSMAAIIVLGFMDTLAVEPPGIFVIYKTEWSTLDRPS
jgi:hypothetical protein